MTPDIIKGWSLARLVNGTEVDVPNYRGEIQRYQTKITPEIELLTRDSSRINEVPKDLFISDKHREEAVFNIQQIQRKREDGRPYISHCFAAALTGIGLLEDLVEKGDVESEAIELMKTCLVFHDTYEEGLEYDHQRMRRLRKENPEFREGLDAAILLAADKAAFSKKERKIAQAYQIREYGSPAYAYALVADKLHNLLDLGYLDGKHPGERKLEITQKFLAPLLYIKDNLEDMLHPKFTERVRHIARSVQEEERITDTQLEKEIEELSIIQKHRMPGIGAKADIYLSRAGFDIGLKNKITLPLRIAYNRLIRPQSMGPSLMGL